MGRNWTYILLVLLALNVIGTIAGGGRSWHQKGRHHDSSEEDCDDDDDDRHHDRHHHGHHDGHHKGFQWTRGGGIGVLVVIIVVICCLVVLVGWLSCKVYTKCRDRKISGEKGKNVSSNTPPEWARCLMYQPEMSVGFGLVSDGLARVGPSHLIRKRQGSRVTDGATWAVPMTTGKHVFEITWPWSHRGSHASVGVGTTEAPLKGKGSHSLVGSSAHTWGLDIVSCKARHANRVVMDCPTDGSSVPDKFLMYVNVDDGTLGFGNEVTYWGDVITGLPKEGRRPLYVMVGTSRWQAELSVQYLGSAANGDNDMTKQNPPHHLPPLAFRAPPTYTEVAEQAGPIMVKPATPTDTKEEPEEPTEKPTSPPPPYVMHHPVGYTPPNNTHLV